MIFLFSSMAFSRQRERNGNERCRFGGYLEVYFSKAGGGILFFIILRHRT